METPRKSVPRMTPMVVRVVAAFFDSGLRKAGTPLEMASTPERATAPEEKPRRIKKSVSEPPACFTFSARSASKGTGSMSPKKTRINP
jgi:hypothetical protein